MDTNSIQRILDECLEDGMEINRFPQCLKSIVFLFQSLEKAGREGEVGIKGALEKDAPPTDLYPDVFPAPQGAPHQDPLMASKTRTYGSTSSGRFSFRKNFHGEKRPEGTAQGDGSHKKK